MSALSFKEIQEAHVAEGDQDSFELFGREFFTYQGYRILADPNRGPDGGADIVVEETRFGIGGETKIRWLVSCKHKAHSGRSVTPQDETNIRDRVEANHCTGFIGFYSTLASSGLSQIIHGLEDKIQTQIFDHEKIEGAILNSSEGLLLAERFFPDSMQSWRKVNNEPAEIYSKMPKLTCKYCGKNLFEPERSGIVVTWSKRDEKDLSRQSFEEIYWCCKGNCDKALSPNYRALDLDDGWEDITDLILPVVFIKWVISPLNMMHKGITFSHDAFIHYKELILSLFPYVARHTSDNENQRIQALIDIPIYLGGLGTQP